MNKTTAWKPLAFSVIFLTCHTAWAQAAKTDAPNAAAKPATATTTAPAGTTPPATTPPAAGTPAAPATAAPGTAAPAAAPPAAPPAAVEDKRQEAVLLQRAADEKEAAKQRAIDTAKQRIEDQKRQKEERERSCVVKPVMTDAEIANCREVWGEKEAVEAVKKPAKAKSKKKRQSAAAAAPSHTEANP